MNLSRRRLVALSVLAIILLLVSMVGYSVWANPRVDVDSRRVSIGFLPYRVNEAHAASDWNIVFNPTGTKIEDNFLKIRLDFYPSEKSLCYDKYYISVPIGVENYLGKVDKDGYPLDWDDFNRWVDGLPREWKLTYAFGLFVKAPESIDTAQLNTFIEQVLHADVVASIDYALTQPDPVHLISPYMLDKNAMTNEPVSIFTNKLALVNNVNTRLAGFSKTGESVGVSQIITPHSIIVGSDSLDRAQYENAGNTCINFTNPANESGTVDTVKLYFNTDGSGVEWGTFYQVSGTTYQCRDSTEIGSVTAGAERLFSGLSIDTTSGDFAGVYWTGGRLERDSNGGVAEGIRTVSGEHIDPGDSADFSSQATYDMLSARGISSDEPAITVSPTSYDFGVVATSSTPYTATNYFTIDNTSSMQTDQTISVTTNTWSGGVGWAHSDTAEAGSDQVGLKANKGGSWGTGDVIVKYTSPNYIAEDQAATTDYSFGLQLIAPTVVTDGVEKSVTVRISAAAG